MSALAHYLVLGYSVGFGFLDFSQSIGDFESVHHDLVQAAVQSGVVVVQSWKSDGQVDGIDYLGNLHGTTTSGNQAALVVAGHCMVFVGRLSNTDLEDWLGDNYFDDTVASKRS